MYSLPHIYCARYYSMSMLAREWRECSAAESAPKRGPRASSNTRGRCSRRGAPQEAGAGRARECS